MDGGRKNKLIGRAGRQAAVLEYYPLVAGRGVRSAVPLEVLDHSHQTDGLLSCTVDHTARADCCSAQTVHTHLSSNYSSHSESPQDCPGHI